MTVHRSHSAVIGRSAARSAPLASLATALVFLFVTAIVIGAV